MRRKYHSRSFMDHPADCKCFICIGRLEMGVDEPEADPEDLDRVAAGLDAEVDVEENGQEREEA